MTPHARSSPGWRSWPRTARPMRSCTAPRSRPTRCSSARARAWRWSRPRASRTCCGSAGRRGASCTTSSCRDRAAAGRARADVRRAASGSTPAARLLEPLDESRLDALIATLQACDVEAVAVCLLHSYVESRSRSAASRRGCEQRRLRRLRVASKCCPSIASSSAGARRSSTRTSRR